MPVYIWVKHELNKKYKIIYVGWNQGKKKPAESVLQTKEINFQRAEGM